MAHLWRGVLREYADRLGVTDASTVVTLGEGGTPLLPAPALSRRTGADVWVKFEGMNPTGSFKDRGMTVAVSRAIDRGAKAIICASTGNTSASAAAYAAHAGITAAVLVPEGKIAMGKLSQAVAHNGQLIQIRGNFDDCLEIARELAGPLPGAPGELGQPRPHRGPEDGRVRGRRDPRRRAGLPFHPGRERGQLHRVLARLPRRGRPRGVHPRPAHVRLPGRGQRAPGARRSRQEPGDGRQRDPDRQSRVVGARPGGARCHRRILRRHRRRPHPGRAEAPRRRGRHLRRARLRDQRRGSARPRRGRCHPEGCARRPHRHRARIEGPAVGTAQRRRLPGGADRRGCDHVGRGIDVLGLVPTGANA